MRALIRVSLVTMLLVQAGSAQEIYPNPPWCESCYIEAQVDSPRDMYAHQAWGIVGGPLVRDAGWYIAGWAFVCNSGTLPDRYEVYYRNDDGSLSLAKTTYWNRLPRPDVKRAFKGSRCTPAAHSGYHIYFLEPLPKGTRELWVTVWSGALRHTRYRVVTIL